MARIAIAAETAYTPGGRAGPWFDDQLLLDALQATGHQAAIIDWEDPGVDLVGFDAIFVSTTWNTSADPAKYVRWLDACEADGRRRLINDRAVLEAGLIKTRYWRTLADGLARSPALRAMGRLTPTGFYIEGDAAYDGAEPLAGRSLADVLAHLDGDPEWAAANLVIKPVVSADGIDTFVYNRRGLDIPIDADKRAQFVLDTADRAETEFARLAASRARGGVVLQPYMTGVEAGEHSLTLLGRACVHAVRKPKLFKGDGSRRREAVALDALPAGMRDFAEGLVASLDDQMGKGSVSRARVDLFDQDGEPVLCELECGAPNTNLRLLHERDPEAAKQVGKRYAEVIAARAEALAR